MVCKSDEDEDEDNSTDDVSVLPGGRSYVRDRRFCENDENDEWPPPRRLSRRRAAGLFPESATSGELGWVPYLERERERELNWAQTWAQKWHLERPTTFLGEVT